MKINKITYFIFIFYFVQIAKAQTIDKSFSGCWADTFWDFEFKKNGDFTRISNGHFGNTTVKGKYQIENDTLKILKGFKDTYGTINENYIIQEDTILIDIKLGYGYVKSSKEYPKKMKCGLSYPEIIGTNEKEVNELEKILNLALNSSATSQFYHFEELPTRKPIIANYHKLNANIEIEGRKTYFADKKDINEKFFLEFEDVEIYNKHISFTVIIHDEGAEVKFYYYKENEEWKSYEPIVTEK
ncbi:hypothetical protein [Flavobacterium sp.]|uniref:hypothetical protein n=1 Tax=Flavobacterium sp. TaxID=239 RepID=UPI003D2CA514